MSKAKSFIIFLIIIILLALIAFLRMDNSNAGTGYSLSLDKKEINILLADTQEKRVHGLSDRKSLPKNTVMLFVFDGMENYKIWMKDMLFSLDVIWLDEKFKIIHIEENLTPKSYPNTFGPSDSEAKVIYIIEANGGFVQKYNLKVGNFLNLIKK